MRSRFTRSSSRIAPLCMKSQRPCRNGWQFVCCTGLPIAARMCAKTSGERVAGDIPHGSRAPRALAAVEHAGGGVLVIPADPEPVAVGRLGAEARVKALVDERM